MAGGSEDEGVWRSILQSCAHESQSLAAANMLLLGDRNCGKTHILQRLQREQDEHLSKGVALDYSFLDVVDDNSDDVLGRIHVWQLEGDTEHVDLLRFALNEKNVLSSVAVICVDMSEPWTLEQQLNKWLGVLQHHLQSLRLPTALSKKARRANEQRFTGYQEPKQEQHTAKHKASFLSISKKKEEEGGEAEGEEASGDAGKPDLPPNVLSDVLEVPVVVVGCKSDVIESFLARQYHYNDDVMDYIQQHLRRLCIKYGAGLVYSSAQKDINCELLRSYLEHVLYGFDFMSTAQVSDREAIFVPIGWDSMDKIQLEFDTQRACSDPAAEFSSVVVQPEQRDTAMLEKEDVEDFQEFLEKHKSTIEKIDLIKGGGAPSSEEATLEASKQPQPSTPIKASPAAASPATTPTARSATTPSASPSVDNPEAIHNFFQSLLGDAAGGSK